MAATLPEPVRLVRRDIREAAQMLTDDQARFFVDYYYAIQDFRIQSGNQVSAAKRTAKAGAVDDESTVESERAALDESASIEERAAVSESAVTGDRVELDESTTMDERAAVTESTDSRERAKPVEGAEMEELNRIMEPHAILSYTFDTMQMLETTIAKTLDDYSSVPVLGQWAKSITGIGPVIAAGLLAHIDIHQAPTVGHIWSFAGLNPDRKWEKKTKRPWNAKLKVLCWKIGESFVKVQANDKDVYGKVYAARKEQEWSRNLDGVFADQARASLVDKNFREGTDAHTWYSGKLTAEAARTILALPSASRAGAVGRLAGAEGSGVPMLPPARIHLRSTRYAVKLFLAHYHHVGHETVLGSPPPFPYVLTHLGHVDYIGPPNWPMG